MALKRKNVSLDEVINKKICYCNKVFTEKENLSNIKKHFEKCDACKITQVDIRKLFRASNSKTNKKSQTQSDERETSVPDVVLEGNEDNDIGEQSHIPPISNELSPIIAMHHRFLMALVSHDVPRLRQLISVCMRQKRSMTFIVDKLEKAISGIYNPKGYNQLDYDICPMVLLTGGPRLLHVLHQTSGLPSLCTAYRVVDRENALKDVHLTLTTMCDIENMVQTNVKKVLEISKTLRSGPTMWSVKVDEVATEKRLRYKTETNEIYGLCATHSKKENVTFTNIRVAEQLERCLEEETHHLATESCIFSLSSMGDTEYHAIPFLSFPICNHDTQSQQKAFSSRHFTPGMI